ncbi:MAG TPA: B12-binding domain-containing radical SAM protein [Desulfatiglandales bacterium]|nr:B12-binding domain-containing radical SAM protein [Desulfatiglandales bacterium]
MKSTVILINPWVYDFAAYDLWAKPLGLLYLAGRLKALGFQIHLLDCLDLHNPYMEKAGFTKRPLRRRYGTGKFWKQHIPKPPQLSNIPRAYSRYGIAPHVFERELQRVRNPAAILVTSLMTYWYPGVFEAIRLAKDVHPNVPVVLGGIYASFCSEHARTFSQADLVITSTNQFRPAGLNDFLRETIPDFTIEKKSQPFMPYPAFDLLTKIDYVCLLGSSGCPFRCTYCASHYLNPYCLKRQPNELFEEVLFWHKEYDVIDFAFYDDALLVDAENHICLFLEEVVRNNLNVRFHCPNGLHIAYLNREIAALLHKAGFKLIKLGLETTDNELHQRLGKKFSGRQFEGAVKELRRAGFKKDQIGAYILAGLPGQTYDQVAKTIRFAGKIGCMPYLSEYSPIPHTELWKEAQAISRFDLAAEPLFHNNSLLPCWDGDVFKELAQLKGLTQEIRAEVRNSC